MTSLSTSQAAAEPATGTADAGRPVEDRAARIERLREAAYRVRLNALLEGEVQGQGYIGQALGVADVLAVAYGDVLRYRPEDPHWEGRDRFLLSIGHYAIALYAALAEAGIIPVEELETYGSDESRLPMSGMASYTPGMEISGGSLGHGLTVATGMGLGLRHLGNPARVYNLLSDGELDEGSTWEAALQCAHHGLDNVTAIVDVNALQADGPTEGILRTEPVLDKWQAFGWKALRVDGNDIAALVDAFDELRAHKGSPSVLICDTRIGCGVPLLETREKAHFMRVAEHEWQIARDQLKEGFDNGRTHRRHRGADPMSTTTPAPEAVPAAPKKKRLTTSAMIASFADPGQKTAPAPFGHALAKLAQERPEIVGLSADLAKYTDMHIFRDAHPQRFFQMGMAEQAMLGAAAGMAEVGLVPFASTYSVFATRRAYDFLCLDIAEPNLNVNIVGALPGLTTGYGPSHQATEDLAILRGCPNLTIVDPCDSVDIEQAVPQLAAHAGPTYLRLLRGRCRRCSTSTATGSSWARPPSCAPAATSCSSPPA